MKRWNGWGDETIDYPLPQSAVPFLEAAVGRGSPPGDALLAEVLAAIPPSRLSPHPLISTDPEDRVRHARGQSLPDWVALRSGKIGVFPDGVACPTAQSEVRAIIQFAGRSGAVLIPYGGGTSVVGHVTPLPGDRPILTVDLGHLNQLLRLDPMSQLASFGAGICGPDLEAQLRAQGYTLGHFPQSFEYSTLGGWIATRSSGQQSLGYGRIENLFAGGHLETPAGPLDLAPFPASAAGPDLREAILGSEGRLGILTEATVRITALPAREAIHTVFFPNWVHALSAVREIAQARLPLNLLRLSTAAETRTTLALAGHEQIIRAMERLLSMRRVSEEKCMLLIGLAGSHALVRAARGQVLAIARAHGGVHLGRTFGQQWHKNRFRTPYLRNTLWEMGYAVDTLETAADWAALPGLLTSLESTLREGLAETGEQVHVFSHLSHLYASGSSLYTTYLFRAATDPEETLRRWSVLKTAATTAIVDGGGTVSHQHGVGTDHLPFVRAEKGELGVALIQDLCRRLDPQGLMNPGKLVP